MIDYACPMCRAPMSSPDGRIGKSEKCPKCGTVTIVPRPRPTATRAARKPGEFGPIMNIGRQRPNRMGRFGVAGLFIGVVACVTLWAPVGFLHTAVIGAVGLALTCLGFLSSRGRQGGNIAIPFVACVMCGVAIYFSLFSGGGAVEALVPATAPPAEAAPLPIGMACQWDNRSLKVLAVKIDNVPLKSITGESRSEDKFFMVAIEASNTSALPDRKITYITLRGASSSRDRTFASLSDSKGNIYNRIDFGPDTYPSGGVHRSAPLGGGKSIRDFLIFERPTEDAGPYRLELPLGNLGGVGVARWEIPESALR